MSLRSERFAAGHEERFRVDESTVTFGEEEEDPELKAKVRRFKMLAYTGTEIGRGWGRMILKTAGIERDDTMGMLVEHDDMAGVAICDSHEITPEGHLKLEGYFLSSKASDHVDQLLAKADEGWPFKASVGVRFISHHVVEDGSEEEVNARSVRGECLVVDRCHLFETSFIHTNPADLDSEASVMRAKQQEGRMAIENTTPPPAAPVVTEQMRAEIRKEERAAILKRDADVDATLLLLPKPEARAALKAEALAKDLSIPDLKGRVAEILSAEATERLKADNDRDSIVADLSKKTRFNGLGFDAGRGELDSSSSSQHADRLRGLPIEERAKIEVGDDQRIQAIFGMDAERIYASVLKYTKKLHNGKPVIKQALVDKVNAALHEICADDRGFYGSREGFARLAGAGKAALDLSQVTPKGFIGSFHQGMDEELNGHWAPPLLFDVESTQETEVVRWLGMFPQLQPWRGARQERPVPVYKIQFTSDLYEATLGFDKMDWRLQKFGLISNLMGQSGAVCARHWEKLFSSNLEANNNGYDGLTYFNGAHTLGGDSGTWPNDFTSTGSGGTGIIPALAVADPGKVTPLEAAYIILYMYPKFRLMYAANGEPINGTCRKVTIMVHPSQEGPFETAIAMDRLDLGASNPLKESAAKMDFKVISNARLKNAQYVYMFREDTPHKPFLKAEPEPIEMLWQGPGSILEYMEHKYGFGVESMRSVANGAFESSLRGYIGAH